MRDDPRDFKTKLAAEAIRRRHEEGQSFKAIGAEYGVTRQRVYQILRAVDQSLPWEPDSGEERKLVCVIVDDVPERARICLPIGADDDELHIICDALDSLFVLWKFNAPDSYFPGVFSRRPHDWYLDQEPITEVADHSQHPGKSYSAQYHLRKTLSYGRNG